MPTNKIAANGEINPGFSDGVAKNFNYDPYMMKSGLETLQSQYGTIYKISLCYADIILAESKGRF